MSIQINKHSRYSKEKDHDDFAIVRLHNMHIKKLGGRNSWVRLELQGKKPNRLYRMIKGCGSQPDFPMDGIQTDYDTSLAISKTRPEAEKYTSASNGYYPCTIKIKKANWGEVLVAHWNHPNHFYRLPMRLSLIGLLIGVLGFIQGMMPK